MNDEADDERVGRGRPPVASRFQKGVSGNPSGRPKKSASFKSDLLAELSRKIDYTEGGTRHNLTVQQAVIRSMTSAAIDGNGKAVSALIACLRVFAVETDNSASQIVDGDDLEILRSYVEREQTNPTLKPKDKLP